MPANYTTQNVAIDLKTTKRLRVKVPPNVSNHTNGRHKKQSYLIKIKINSGLQTIANRQQMARFHIDLIGQKNKKKTRATRNLSLGYQ